VKKSEKNAKFVDFERFGANCGVGLGLCAFVAEQDAGKAPGGEEWMDGGTGGCMMNTTG